MPRAKSTSQKRADLKALGKQARENIYAMLKLADEILKDQDYVDQFHGGEIEVMQQMEADEFVHFGGDPSLAAMLKAYRENPGEDVWQEYRYNIRAMIDLAKFLRFR